MRVRGMAVRPNNDFEWGEGPNGKIEWGGAGIRRWIKRRGFKGLSS